MVITRKPKKEELKSNVAVKAESDEFDKGVEIDPVEPVKKSKSTKKVLAIDLGCELKAGTELTEEQYADLIGAGFTEERLFGK